jgi:hypothetical protein
VNRIDVIRAAVSELRAERYLEIGVKDGVCFHAIDVPTRVAVDPHFAFRPPLVARARTLLHASTGSLYFETTSDDFFRRHAHRVAPFDLVFVDGLHTYEQAYRDVVNSLERLRGGGVIVIHDCNPASPAAAAPTLEQAGRMEGWNGEWNGDVYKAIVRLRSRHDVRVAVLDTDQGVGIVTRGVSECTLVMVEEDIDRLEYEDLDRDRKRLLDLRPPTDLPVLLAARWP